MSINNIEKFYQNILDMNIVIFKELTINKYKVNDKIYEDKEFLIQDLAGYLLRFND